MAIDLTDVVGLLTTLADLCKEHVKDVKKTKDYILAAAMNGVPSLQRMLGVDDDGIVGPITRKALDDIGLDVLLDKLLSAPPPRPAPTPIPEPTPVVDGYPPDFMDAVKQVLVDEGGYGNDPDDPGGETNFGIDKRSHPDVDIKNLTQDQAIDIYYQEYWHKYRLDLLPSGVNKKMFNVGVNTGMGQAAKFLQRAVGVHDDGVVGLQTLTAVGKADPQIIVQSIRDQQKQFYIDLVGRKPSMRKFLGGWLKRAVE